MIEGYPESVPCEDIPASELLLPRLPPAECNPCDDDEPAPHEAEPFVPMDQYQAEYIYEGWMP